MEFQVRDEFVMSLTLKMPATHPVRDALLQQGSHVPRPTVPTPSETLLVGTGEGNTRWIRNTPTPSGATYQRMADEDAEEEEKEEAKAPILGTNFSADLEVARQSIMIEKRAMFNVGEFLLQVAVHLFFPIILPVYIRVRSKQAAINQVFWFSGEETPLAYKPMVIYTWFGVGGMLISNVLVFGLSASQRGFILPAVMTLDIFLLMWALVRPLESDRNRSGCRGPDRMVEIRTPGP